ncbi:MAG: UDP-N-acetylmuramate:L-alanyl-gamma-D-glutamyl-meso-diaminopimelate ligase [Gammaproteobacteria bacterium]
MHIHILGICGTFMGGIAQLARALGHKVTGSDTNIYPPMSEHLHEAGIPIREGYLPAHLQPAPDLVLIGNALSRGNAAVEYVLSQGIHYDSGAAWLRDALLRDKQVIAVAGTHGKTTTTALITWILEANNYHPGYLIGGRANNFELTAALGDSDIFVIEADEYDTAFFDKRSKFIHYQPDVFIINNLEFDHADIFDNIADIRRQFHHAIRTVPADGLIIANTDGEQVERTISMGCWTPVHTFGVNANARWMVTGLDNGKFQLTRNGETFATFSSPIPGMHNALNTAAALIAATHVGLTVEQCLAALGSFRGVKRRLDNFANVNGIALYDDFAHHPTAIQATLKTLKGLKGAGKVRCVLEPRSNTMRDGTHREALKSAFDDADTVYLYEPDDLQWNLTETAESIGSKCFRHKDINELIDHLCETLQYGDHVVIMSNGGFQGFHKKLQVELENNQR